MEEKYSVESLTKAILEGFKSEGFSDVGYLEKFARGIAKGIYSQNIKHSFSFSIGKDSYSAFDPFSVVDI